jgi:hypothetical protein
MAVEAVDKDYLILHFSEFAGEDAERIASLGVEAASIYGVDESVFGPAARYALACLVAHMLKLSSLQGAGGAITALSVGDISESFATPSGTENSLMLTSYGQEYRRIARSKSAAFRPRFVS